MIKVKAAIVAQLLTRECDSATSSLPSVDLVGSFIARRTEGRNHDRCAKSSTSAQRGSPVSVPVVPEPPHDLHVLLRHRLHRQPHGFEGFGGGAESVDPRDLAVAKRGGLKDGAANVGPTGLTHAPKLNLDDDGVGRIGDNLNEFDAEVRNGSEDFDPHPLDVISPGEGGIARRTEPQTAR
jgi:hypothetical protein